MSLFASSLFSLTLLASPADPYLGHSAVRVQANDAAAARLVERASTVVLDENLHTGPLHVVIDGPGLAELDAAGLSYEIVEEDVHARLLDEQARLQNADVPRDFDAWFEDFKTLDQIYERIDELAAMAPDLVEVTELGQSVEGRPIKVVRIGTGDRPAVIITGIQHAREWIASMVPVCLLDTLVRDGETNIAVQAALANTDIYIVPIVNPDGFEFTWDPNGDRFWRKNRRNGTGVDLNRNWGEGWGLEMGSSPDPDSDNFHGPNAFSEPETQLVRDLIQSKDVAALIDFHSFAAVVSSSWAYTDDQPEDIVKLRAWGDGLADQLGDHHDYGYQSLHGQEANQTIGYAAGTMPDWTHAETGVPAFTIELRPSFNDEGGGHFEVPPETIIPTCEENVATVLDLARWATGSDEPKAVITSPPDGTNYEQIPAFTDILVDVDYAGPLANVQMRINGELQTWNDTVFPHDAGIEFPEGTWELVAVVETWDGKTTESEPVTVTVGQDASDDGGDEGEDGGDGDGDGDGDDDDGGTGDDGASQDDESLDRGGCGCATDDSRPMPWLLLALLFGVRRRR